MAVQGVGHVGYQVCKLLHEAGAELIVADVNRENLRRVTDEFGATQVGIESIVGADCDILSPCALGNVINQQSIPMIRAKIIAGAANNQLGRDEDGGLLREAGILFAPDYVINAGGIIAVAREHLGGATENEVRDEIDKISARVAAIYAESDQTGESTNNVADRLAKSIVSGAANSDSRLIA